MKSNQHKNIENQTAKQRLSVRFKKRKPQCQAGS